MRPAPIRTARMAVAVLATAWLLNACGDGRADRTQPPPLSPAAQREPAPFDERVFEQAFSSGFELDSAGVRLRFRVQPVGLFRNTSGRLAACDPYVCEPKEALLGAVPVGEFPLQLALAARDGDERVAFAKIAFTPAEVARWELARFDGTAVPDTGHVGYGVDGGTGAFMDPAADVEFRARYWDRGAPGDLHDELMRNFAATRAWLLVQFRGGSFAAFSSGYGDGVYLTYWGYDRDGRLAAVLTDFGVVPVRLQTSAAPQ